MFQLVSGSGEGGWGGGSVAVADHPPPHFGRHSEPPSSFQAGPEGICSGNSGVSVRLGPPSASCSESLLCKHRQGAFLPGRGRFELPAPWPERCRRIRVVGGSDCTPGVLRVSPSRGADACAPGGFLWI